MSDLPAISMDVHVDDDSLVFRVSMPALFDESSISSVVAGIIYHDEVDSDFYASIPMARTAYGFWTGKLPNFSTVGLPISLLELTSLDLRSGDQPMIPSNRLRGGMDYARCFGFIEDPSTLAARPSRDSQIELEKISRAREAVINSPIRSASGGATQYRVFLLSDGCYFTRRLWVPGAVLIPVQQSARGADIAQIVNDVLVQFGSGTRLEPLQWTAQYAASRPVVVCMLPNVLAADKGDALEVARATVLSLLDMASLQRGAAAELVCAVVERKVDSGEWVCEGVTNEHGVYGGNLIGGFASGENQRALLQDWHKVQSDDRTSLWLSLYSDAKREKRWDFRWFRLFGLMETISRELYGDAAAVVDFSGAQLLAANGSPALTNQARGKVYLLCRNAAVSANSHEANYCVDKSASLWDEVRIWTDVRNEVAHNGGFRENSQGQQSPGEARVNAAFAAASLREPVVPGRAQYLRLVDEVVRLVLSCRIKGAI